MSGKITLVLGGAASGKSAFAESIVIKSGLTRIYIATARVLDAEMITKVSKHKTMRGAGWRTIETPLDPQNELANCGADEIVLIDCATMWLMNHQMDDTDLDAATKALLTGLETCRADCVIVSNELGLGIVPGDAYTRKFRQAQGELNQRLAAQADTVVSVIAGLPQLLKGHL